VSDFDLERFRAGDAAFFRNLHDRHRGYLMAIILSCGKDMAWAEDRHQEVWLAIWQKRRTLRRGRSFTAWAGRIARNVCVNALRALQRDEARIASAEDEQPEEEPATEEPDPLARAQARQFRERLLEKLQELPKAQREAFHLVHLEDCSAKEAAEILGTGASTVRSNVRHAVNRLAELLAEFRP